MFRFVLCFSVLYCFVSCEGDKNITDNNNRTKDDILINQTIYKSRDQILSKLQNLKNIKLNYKPQFGLETSGNFKINDFFKVRFNDTSIGTMKLKDSLNDQIVLENLNEENIIFTSWIDDRLSHFRITIDLLLCFKKWAVKKQRLVPLV